MAGNSGYEVIYNVGLLDDIHNYFPALLYESGRFTSLAQVFHYVRHQMNTRFNLFSYGASRHNDTAAETVIFTSPLTPMRPIPRHQPTSIPQEETLSNLQTTNLLLGLLGLGVDTTTNVRRGNAFRDIIVRPTSEQIEAASERIIGLSLTEETRCAICQDTITVSDTCRRLRHCNHTYHQTCIDQWFLRSVYCPTCRHDIRENNPTSLA